MMFGGRVSDCVKVVHNGWCLSVGLCNSDA